MDPKHLTWVHTALLVAIGAGLLYVGARQADLDRRLAAVEQAGAAPAPLAATRRAERAAAVATGAASAAGASVAGAAVAGSPAEPASEGAIEDHLWSEGGRAAIDDVVAEREEREQQRMRERWQKMTAWRAQSAVDGVARELSLDAETTAALQDKVTAYLEQRGRFWEQMRSDDVDPAAIHEERQAARDRFHAEIEALVGADGLSALEGALEGGRGPF